MLDLDVITFFGTSCIIDIKMTYSKIKLMSEGLFKLIYRVPKNTYKLIALKILN